MSTQQENSSKKPTLAIVSSYEDHCGNASYTRALEENLSQYFDVTVLVLRTSPVIRESKDALDKNVEEICKRLPEFDVVNLQFEAGLFGVEVNGILARVDRVIKASKNLIITYHRVDMKKRSHSFKQTFFEFAINLKRLKILTIIDKMFSGNDISADITTRITTMLKKRSASNPYYAIVHRPIDVTVLDTVYGLPREKVSCYPLAYYSPEKISSLKNMNDPIEWKKRNGIPPEKKVIGVFGFFGAYKGFPTAIQALAYLPNDYALAIVGGQHPSSIQMMKVDQNVTDLQAYLIDPNNQTFTQEQKDDLLNRVFFLGLQSTDEDMVESILSVDYVVLPYYEVGQSGSGIASMAIELGKRTILTRTNAFTELEKFYPACFESFDIGNALELRQKIIHYNDETLANREPHIKRSGAQALADEYFRMYQDMTGKNS